MCSTEQMMQQVQATREKRVNEQQHILQHLATKALSLKLTIGEKTSLFQQEITRYMYGTINMFEVPNTATEPHKQQPSLSSGT